MRSRRFAPALVVLTLLAASLPLSPALAAPTLPPILELPPWAIGFFWTYHYEGATSQSFAGFTATSLTDTYTSSIVGETASPRGDAWVVRNYHSGSMSGLAPIGSITVPASAVFTSLTYSWVRKSDLSTLNFTQDLDITATIQFLGTIHALAHNETYADPPLAEIAFGAPADGSTWRVFSNLTSTGWFQIDPGPRTDTSSYVVVDYNMSVVATETVTVPAGAFDAYNMSGFGTLDYNGTVYAYTESSLWSPKAQERVRDEAGFELTSLFVNRPPRLVTAIPPVRVPSPGYNDSLNLSLYLTDPEGGALTFSSCVPDAPLSCTLAPTGVLNLSAPPGVNATLGVTVVADDGLPSGASTFSLVALVRGPGNTSNLPPVWVGGALSMDEDSELVVDFETLFTDPEGGPVTALLAAVTNLYIVVSNASSVRLRPPSNFNGLGGLTFTVFDDAGNDVRASPLVEVRPVNDVPWLLPASPLDTTFHAGVGSFVFEVVPFDPDAESLSIGWTFDGEFLYGDRAAYFAPASNLSSGVHTLSAVCSDGIAFSEPINFTIRIFEGPNITATDPPLPAFRIANNTSYMMGVNATDADSPTLHFRWTAEGGLLAEGDGLSQLLVVFAHPGTHTVSVMASDNATNDSRTWAVLVQEAPPGLVQLLRPADGTTVEANATVNVSALVSPLLSNVSLTWSLDGTAFSDQPSAATPALAPGNHTVTLRASGLFDTIVPYSATFEVVVHVNAPPSDNGTGGNNNGNGGTHPPPVDAGLGWLPFALIGALAPAGAGAALYLRRRQTPPSPPPPPP